MYAKGHSRDLSLRAHIGTTLSRWTSRISGPTDIYLEDDSGSLAGDPPADRSARVRRQHPRRRARRRLAACNPLFGVDETLVSAGGVPDDALHHVGPQRSSFTRPAAQVGVTSERVVGSVLENSLAALRFGDGDEVDRHARHLPMRGKWTTVAPSTSASSTSSRSRRMTSRRSSASCRSGPRRRNGGSGEPAPIQRCEFRSRGAAVARPS